MIKKITLSLVLSIFSLIVFAKNIPVNTAKIVASNYMTSLKKDFNNTIVETFTLTYRNHDVIYAFNFEKGGYILISADDCAYPILNYSFAGTFDIDESKMPEAYKCWINGYKKQIAYIIDNNIKAYPKTITAWDKYSKAQSFGNKSINDVLTPLFGPDGDANSIRWDQYPIYNDSCPENPNNYTGHSPVGCVATAMSQIMYYHKYPSTGTGSHSYSQGSANFGATTYNWNAMVPKLTSSSPTEAKIEIARISYHAGVSVNMNYGDESSGTQTSYVDDAFKNYFRYPNATYVSRRSNTLTITEWKNTIKTNLDNGNPVLYSGNDGGSVGHAFVCDGYNSNDEFHFNFGWSGSYNGWFTIEDLAPSSGLNFSEGQKMVYDIYPAGMIVDFSASATTISQNESVTFTDLTSDSPTSWSWDFGDGSTSTQQNPTHTYTTEGTYTVSLTATNADGSDTETKTDYITVLGPAVTPVADFTANATTISENETVTFTDLTSNTPTSWSWDFGDGTTSTQQSPSHTYTTAGTYTVSLTASNSAGSDTETKTDYITVNPASPTYCTSSGSMNYETAVTLVNINTINNSTGKNNPYEDYTNISTDLSLNNSYDISVNVNTAGSYYVYAKVWIDWNHDFDFDDAGEEYDLGNAYNVSDGATSNSPLTITVPANANIGTTLMRVSAKYSSSATACQEGFDGEVEDYTINITNTSTTNPPNVTTYSASNLTQTSATLNGRITSNGGATVTESGFVYSSNANPTIGGAGVIQIQTSPTVTIGSFTENVINLNTGTTYYYKAYAINSEGISYGVEQSFTPDYLAGNHSEFISQTIPTTVNTGEVFSISLTFENTGNTTWESTGTEPYNLGSQAPQDNFTWGTNRIAMPNEVAPGEQVTITADLTAPSTAGTYDFQWQMVQDYVEWFGEMSDLVSIEVIEQTTNLSKINNEMVNIYPNPATNYLHVILSNTKADNIKIIDITGKTVKQFNVQDKNLKIKIEDLQKGIYFIKIDDKTYKFIKE